MVDANVVVLWVGVVFHPSMCRAGALQGHRPKYGEGEEDLPPDGVYTLSHCGPFLACFVSDCYVLGHDMPIFSAFQV